MQYLIDDHDKRYTNGLYIENLVGLQHNKLDIFQGQPLLDLK
jgi:hypothetical protein